MTDIENTEVSQNTNITKDELIELKKQLATEVVEKLLEKDPNLASSLPKKSMTDYLVDEKTIEDVFHDEILLGGLGELIGLTITPALKKYREMFSSAHTKDDLENLKTTIFNEIGGNLQASTSTQESSNTSTNESSESNESTGNTKATNEKTQKKEESKKEESKEGSDNQKTFTNPQSNLTFSKFDQQNGPRGSLRYKDRPGETVGSIGCMITTIACIGSAYDKSITPEYTFKNYTHTPPYKAIPKITNGKLEAKKLSGKNLKENLIAEVDKGNPAYVMVRGPKRGGKNTLTTSQHYIGIGGSRINNGTKEFFVLNTHKNKGGGWIPADKVCVSVKEAGAFIPTQA